MPSSTEEDALLPPGTFCKRCSAHPPVLLVRGDPLCRDCFLKYVSTKCTKRLDGFRVRNADPNKAPRRILVPVSLGVSSVCLLHLVDQMQGSQLVRMKRAGFEVHVLYVAEEQEGQEKKKGEEGEREDDGGLKGRFIAGLRERYPRHKYHSTPLAKIPTTTTRTLASASSYSDIHLIQRTRTITAFAEHLSCEAVLWGDTTTTLAAKILAETAKGRGFSLPWLGVDGPAPVHFSGREENDSGSATASRIQFLYPMRETMKKELEDYARLADLPTASRYVIDDNNKTTAATTTQAAVSSKNTTIDSLMLDYFATVERNFPSIVANVVRTSAKLLQPSPAHQNYQSSSSSSNDQAEPEESCEICGLPVAEGRFGLEGWAGDQRDASEADALQSLSLEGEESDGRVLRKRCYGCTRSLLGSTGWE